MAGGRFFRRGTTKIWFAPTIASAALIPTAAEVNAGTHLTVKAAPADESVKGITGFHFTNSPIDTPDMADVFTGNIPGEDKADASSLDFYEAKTSNAIKTALAKNTKGYIVIFFSGIAGATPAAGDKCDVWPVTSTGPSRNYSAGNEAASYSVPFAMTAAPADTVTLT
jgi:hypothetical protein